MQKSRMEQALESLQEFVGKRATLDFDEIHDPRFGSFIELEDELSSLGPLPEDGFEDDFDGLDFMSEREDLPLDDDEDEDELPAFSYVTSHWEFDEEGNLRLDETYYDRLDEPSEDGKEPPSIEISLEVKMDDEDFITDLTFGIYYLNCDVSAESCDDLFQDMDEKIARDFLTVFTKPKRGRHRKIRRG